jgi:hypothetical protein
VHPCPRTALKGTAGGCNRRIDIYRVIFRGFGDRQAGGRVEHVEGLAGLGVYPRIANQQLQWLGNEPGGKVRHRHRVQHDIHGLPPECDAIPN